MSEPKKKRLTQDEMILQHLQTGASITPAQAVAEYGCYRLAAVINRLRQTYNINKHTESSINRFGVSVHYARYRMAKLPPRMPQNQENLPLAQPEIVS